ncbi:MAG: hypothetical protein LBN11_00885 [Tannerella sp.]|jgi:uncharacterized membrane protein|nr:hypothetical protein [Tannerella sp.]
MMKKKGISVLLLILVCCFSTVQTVVANETTTEILNFSGPWTFGKILAWAFVAFIAFVMLLIFFKLITSSIQSEKTKTDETSETTVAATAPSSKTSSSKDDVSEEVYAAIGMALYESYEDVHDIESAILTLSNLTRTYSPWSSKIYGLREIPVRR